MQVRTEHITHLDTSLRLLQLELDAFAGPFHRHDAMELTWVRRGDGLRFVGAEVSPFHDGDLVLLAGGVPHLWASRQRSRAERQRAGPLRALVLQFPATLLLDSALPELRCVAPLAQRAAGGLAIGGRTARSVCAELSGLPQADDIDRLAGLLRILGALMRGPRDLRPIAPVARGGTAVSQAPVRRIDAVIGWMQAHYRQPLSVDQAAAVAHVTPGAFSRFFKREAGKGFATYLNDLRCAAACVQLREGSRPVAWVAADCGFATLSHFHRQFRQRLGCTPRDFRRSA